MDARHHPFDVLFGSALGILVAWAAYRQYFPPVSQTWLKGRAYPIRTWGKQNKMANGHSNDIAMEPTRQNADSASDIADDEQPPDASVNVFREQIARSQRQRRNGQKSFQPVAGNPYVRQRDHEYSASSSEDERGGQGEEVEMQRPRYTVTDPEGRSVKVARPREEQTGYRGQTGIVHPGQTALT